MDAHRYFILNKPYQMVSQFVSTHPVRLLGDLNFNFPPGTHAIGRLDSNSEGLLLLTTNKKVTRLLFQGKQPHKRTYLVQVKNAVSEESVQQLNAGIAISGKGGNEYKTTPCEVVMVEKPDLLFSSGYELREDVANTWLRITLTEGKFHQVRKMVAAVHHRCKRLIRISIEDIRLEDMKPGEVREMEEQDFFRKLNL
ncbi:MAG: pseudouridine synthase [Sediminibacterium sp.]|nr:pseudouridine synthase [Sediminibacterium sp.]